MNIVKDKNFYKAFFTLTFTIALRNVIVFTVNLADSIMLGRYSEQALSGSALVNQIQFILQLMIMGVCEGTQIFISRAWGGRDLFTMRKAVNISLKLSLLVGFCVAATAFFFPSGILGLLSDRTAIVNEGVRYLNVILFSYPFFAVSTALITAMNSVETVQIGFYTSIGTLIINVCLNYCLIYGNFGFPKLGVRGAAAATLCSRLAECAAVILYTRFADKKIQLRLKHFGKFDRTLFRSCIKKGAPVFLSNTLWGLAMTIQLGILGHMGASAITANSIANTLFQIVTVITYASASATSVVIAKAIGSGSGHLLKPYAKTLQLMYLIIGVFTGAALFFAKDFIVGFYAVSEESRSLALTFMTVLSVTVVGTAYEMPCLTGIVRAGGDTSFVFKNDMIFMWCIVLPISLLCAFYFRLSPAIVFICLKSDQILKCAVAAVKVNRFKWIKSLDAAEAPPA